MGKLNNRSRNSKGQLITGWGYPIRYMGKNYSKPEYLVDNKWTPSDHVPERKVYVKKYVQSKNGYFGRMFRKMKYRHDEIKNNRMGEFEFKDVEDLLNHLHEQQEKYGNKCPITGQTFTMIRLQNKEGRTLTNISPDRLFSPITYTKQNVLFTCVGWNMAKGDLKFYQLPTYFKKELIDRFYKILHERFPELEDIGWEAVDGHE